MISDMGAFEPIHDAHAIEQVAMAIQLVAPLDDMMFALALARTEALREVFPRVMDLPGGGIQLIGAGQQIAIQAVQFPNVISQQQQVSGGRIFGKYRSNGSVESELRVERTSVSYRSSAYTSWRDVWKIAKGYFNCVIPIFAEASIPLLGISLNYVDKFRWNGPMDDIRVQNLLRTGSRYVAPHVFDLKDLWHSHTGAFQRMDDETKRLLIINIDCNDDMSTGVSQRTIAIATILTDMFNQPGYGPKTLSEPASMDFFEHRLKLLHDHGKEIFGETINDDMCKRIGLHTGI